MTREPVEAALSQVLEQVAQGACLETCLEAYPEQRHELEALARLALRLLEAPAVEPSAPFKPQSIGRLAARSRCPSRTAQPGPRLLLRPSWALATVMLIALLAMTGTGLAYAADGAVPGSVLYPIDLGLESLSYHLAASPEQRAALALSFADERLTEAEGILARGGMQQQADQAVQGYGDAIARMQGELAGVASLGEQPRTQALVERIQSAIGSHPHAIGRIRKQLSDDSWSGIDRAMAAWQAGEAALGAALDPKAAAPPAELSGGKLPSNGEQATALAAEADGWSFAQRLASLGQQVAAIEANLAAGKVNEGMEAVVAYQHAIEVLTADIDELEAQDHRQAQHWAALLDGALAAHAPGLSRLLQEVSPEGRPFVEQALHASQDGRRRAAPILGTPEPGGPPDWVHKGPP